MVGKFFSKPDPQLGDRIPPGQYLASGFPVLTYGSTPTVTTDQWELKILGLATLQTLTWQQMMDMPQSDFTADFHCVTRWSKLDVKWTGIKVTDVMQQIQVQDDAKYVMLHCYGGYTTNLNLDDFVRDENFFAHTLFGDPLPPDHGGPMRVVVPHLYAWKSAKWIQGLEFLAEEKMGFWEQNGYHRRGEPWAEERYGGRF